MNTKKIVKQVLSLTLILLLVLSLSACSGVTAAAKPTEQPAAPAVSEPEAPKAPKYVFLFIGDGMGYPQVQAAADYLGAIALPALSWALA